MVSPLILDIETIPTDAALAAPYPVADRNPPANYKSEEAVAKWRASDELAWRVGRVKECSINPRLGRVLCVGMNETVEYATTEADEERILVRFWEEAADADGAVVTWNGAWDLRFLVIRSLVLDLRPTILTSVVRSWFRRYSVEPHFDCKAVLLNWDVRVSGEGLDEWATVLGVPSKTDGMDGSQVYEMFLAGRHAEIAEYCAADVASTKAIYEKICPMFG